MFFNDRLNILQILGWRITYTLNFEKFAKLLPNTTVVRQFHLFAYIITFFLTHSVFIGTLFSYYKLLFNFTGNVYV